MYVCDPLKILTFFFRGFILHVQKNSKQQNIRIHLIITSRTCSTSASREKHNKARRYIL